MVSKNTPTKGGSSSPRVRASGSRTDGKTLFSGAKPTGKLHLGNYLGALKNWVKLQDKYECIFSVVDLHALTIDIHPDELRDNSFAAAVDLLALGIDPKKSILFKQSAVQGHSELAWIFDCLLPVSELERMTQYKDEAQRQSNNINAGLLTYPALQAADILLYKAELVPVGEDQLQHLELTRLAARKFNNRYTKYFPEVKPVTSPAKRVMSLKFSDKKMSKSHGEASYIAIRDDEEVVTKKIKKAIADENGVKNMLELYSYFGDISKHQELNHALQAGKLMNLQLKEELTKAVLEFIEPIQKKIKYYESNPKEVEKVLADGAKRAQKIADKNLGEIKKIVGLK
ncbi:tryptophan--tRNA ligase [bacterium]|nr:tryptophan--tRNA ligase [bacterium]